MDRPSLSHFDFAGSIVDLRRWLIQFPPREPEQRHAWRTTKKTGQQCAPFLAAVTYDGAYQLLRRRRASVPRPRRLMPINAKVAGAGTPTGISTAEMEKLNCTSEVAPS